MQYVGLTWSTGVEFDASWDRGEPFEFKLGEGKVIKGWDEGIPGMKQGGRRELTIPAELAYGAQGSPPDIGPERGACASSSTWRRSSAERLAERSLERSEEQVAQRRAIEVPVLDPVEDRAVHEPQPGAHRGAPLWRRFAAEAAKIRSAV